MAYINRKPAAGELAAYAGIGRCYAIRRCYAGTMIDLMLMQDPDAPDLSQGQFEYAIDLLVDHLGAIQIEDPGFADLVSCCIDRAVGSRG